MRSRFRIIRRSSDAMHFIERRFYRVRMEKALIAALGLFSLLFLLFRHAPRNRLIPKPVSLNMVSYEMIPATRQGGLPRPPNLPSVPMPTEDEFTLEDETIDETALDPDMDIPLFDSDGPWGRGTVGGLTPRPVREVIPEYSETERRRGIRGDVILDILVNAEGKVDSVVIVQNSTLSQHLAAAAKAAAYQSLYVPAHRDGKPVSFWIRRPFRFGKQ